MHTDIDTIAAEAGINSTEQKAIFQTAYLEAQRVMSPRGLDHFLSGMRVLHELGRDSELPLVYARSMPHVVKEIGEDILPSVIEGVMRLQSHTSASIIKLIVNSMPIVAVRLGDAKVFNSYLQLIHHLTAKVPRGLRPMMENIDELLSKLTLGGLRRWATWGTETYGRDIAGQIEYFSLLNASSKSILQRERRGTLFIDNQRKLNFYLRSLWARAFFMRPTSGDFETCVGIRPFIEEFQIYLPDAYDDLGGIDGLSIYRATAAHCAAHLIYNQQSIRNDDYSPVQQFCIGLFEDARVEYLANRDFPGLDKLWLPFFNDNVSALTAGLEDISGALHRVSKALLDPSYQDTEAYITDAATCFRTIIESDPDDLQLCVLAGISFFNEVSTRYHTPSLRILEESMVLYRDDNRYTWAVDETTPSNYTTGHWSEKQTQIRKYVSVMEMVNEIDSGIKADEHDEVWVLASELFPYEDHGVSYNQEEGAEPISAPYLYDEWDYLTQNSRPKWVTLTERRQSIGDPEVMDRILTKYRPVANRLKYLIDAMQPEGLVRQRGHEEGEEIDLNAAIKAMVDIRRGVMPDTRINIRITRHLRDLAVIVLVDLSESTNDYVGDLQANCEEQCNPQSILDLTREATGLLAWAIDAIGDQFAVHGFASNGRQDVQYYRFKNFDERYSEDVRARMAGMQGKMSTRMGAALRHAGWHLGQQENQKKLILLITDGEPADIDERDPQYLRQDTKRAVEELGAQGVLAYCLTLDPNADRYVSSIFGDNRYAVIDKMERLPERLPSVFAQLTA